MKNVYHTTNMPDHIIEDMNRTSVELLKATRHILEKTPPNIILPSICKYLLHVIDVGIEYENKLQLIETLCFTLIENMKLRIKKKTDEN